MNEGNQGRTVVREALMFTLQDDGTTDWPSIKIPDPKPYPTNQYKDRKEFTTRGCF